MNLWWCGPGMAGATWAGASIDRWSQCGAVWPELGEGCLQLRPDQGGHGPAGQNPPWPPPPHGELLALRRHVMQLSTRVEYLVVIFCVACGVMSNMQVMKVQSCLALYNVLPLGMSWVDVRPRYGIDVCTASTLWHVYNVCATDQHILLLVS